MPDVFKFFAPEESCLGVDIGTTSIKIVEVKKGKERPEFVNYAYLESSGYLARANQALQTSSLKLFESEVAEFLKVALYELKPQTKDAFASLPPFAAFIAALDFPDMSPGEVQKSLAFQAKQYIPMPVSEVAIDWVKAGDFEDDKGFKHQEVLLVSVPKEQIIRYQRLFKLVGLNLKSLEIESLSLARILSAGDPTPTVIVDIGSRSTNIVFVENGQLKFNSQSDFAGASLTQALSSSLSINPLRAEELKKERGIVGVGPNYELSTLMLPFLDAIINEVKKAEYAYRNQFPSLAKVERVVLSGGGANLLGIEKYFAGEFNLPVVKAAPLTRFNYKPEVEPVVAELNPIMSVALGLTFKAGF